MDTEYQRSPVGVDCAVVGNGYPDLALATRVGNDSLVRSDGQHIRSIGIGDIVMITGNAQHLSGPAERNVTVDLEVSAVGAGVIETDDAVVGTVDTECQTLTILYFDRGVCTQVQGVNCILPVNRHNVGTIDRGVVGIGTVIREIG